jgi:hypothetical protein
MVTMGRQVMVREDRAGPVPGTAGGGIAGFDLTGRALGAV